MKKLIEIKHSKPTQLRINFDLGNVCNYNCWYCFPDANTGTVPFPDAEIVKHNLIKLIKHYTNTSNITDVKIAFLGGEPTYWKELGEVVQYIKSKLSCQIHIITNGSRSIDWWETYCHFFDSISISIHHERADINHIKQLTNLLSLNQISFQTEVMMDHTNWDKCVSLVDSLVKLSPKFLVTTKPIHINGQQFYTVRQSEYLKHNVKGWPSFKKIIKDFRKYISIANNKFIFDDGTVTSSRDEHFPVKLNMNTFENWECNLGVNLLLVDRLGNLTGGCGEKLYGLDYYFNLYHADFEIDFSPKIQPTICTKQSCWCPGEIVLSKKKLK